MPPLSTDTYDASYGPHPEGRDEALLTAVRAGDPRAFRALHAQYAPALVSLAARRTDDVAAAEDLVQDVFLNVWTNREGLALRASAGTYLFKAVQNRVSKYHRRKKVEKAAAAVAAREIEVADAFRPHSQVEAELDAKRMRTTIEMAIATLPPRAQETYRLVRHERMSYADVARKLNLSIKTVEMHMSRALKHLRAYLLPVA